jgi:hypothetical protein
MHYYISIFAVTPQNYGRHIIEEKGENELILETGKVMKNKMIGHGEKRRKREK